MTLLHVAGLEGRQLTGPANKVKEAGTSTGWTTTFAFNVNLCNFCQTHPVCPCVRSLVGALRLQQPPGDSFGAPTGSEVRPGWGCGFCLFGKQGAENWELGAGSSKLESWVRNPNPKQLIGSGGLAGFVAIRLGPLLPGIVRRCWFHFVCM